MIINFEGQKYTISPYSFEESLCGRWGVYKTQIEDSAGNLLEGYIQGDGHLWAEETLEIND